ncbi:MAG: APC family permease [Polyangiaceae bacterium]
MPARPAGGLGVTDASLLVVGSIVGAGIFLVSPFVAQGVRSPAAFIAVWLLGGVIALSGALTNGELGGLFPRSGGEYVYLREAYGPSLGFLSGWTSFWVAFPGSIAALAAGFGATLAPMLHLSSTRAPVTMGVLVIAVLTVVNALGLRAGTWTQNGLSGIKLAAFAALLGLGLLIRRSGPAGGGGLVPFFAPGDRPGSFAGALIPVMFAYSGWNAATYIAGEMREPTKGLGRALAIGTVLSIALYVAINVAYLRAMPLPDLARTTEPARASALKLGGASAAGVIGPLVAVCILSSLQATILVGPRIYQAMAQDGLFFSAFARNSPRTGVPVTSIFAQGAIAIAELLSGSFDQLLTFAMFAIIGFSTLTVAAVFVLRFRRQAAPRPFRVPCYPFAPAVFIAASAWMLLSVIERGAREAFVGLVVVATGIPVYAVFRSRSRTRTIQE